MVNILKFIANEFTHYLKMEKKLTLVDQPDMATVKAITHLTVARFDPLCLTIAIFSWRFFFVVYTYEVFGIAYF